MNKFVNNIFVLFCWFCFCFVIVLMTRMQPGLSPEFWILFQTIFQTEYILIMNTFHWRLPFFLKAFIMVIILFKFPRLWWNVALALTEPTVQRQSARHPVNLGIVVLLLMNVPPTQLLSTLRTPPLVPALWSMKLLLLLLSQVKLSTSWWPLFS